MKERYWCNKCNELNETKKCEFCNSSEYTEKSIRDDTPETRYEKLSHYDRMMGNILRKDKQRQKRLK
jgi:hypothetical protein